MAPSSSNVKVVSSPRYAIDIGPHVFPTEKFRRIYDRLLATPHPGLDGIVAPQAASWDELALVHTDEYLDKVRTRSLSSEEIPVVTSASHGTLQVLKINRTTRHWKIPVSGRTTFKIMPPRDCATSNLEWMFSLLVIVVCRVSRLRAMPAIAHSTEEISAIVYQSLFTVGTQHVQN